MNANKPAPITCTLSPAEFKDRSAWIAKVTTEALLTHHIQGGTAHLIYRREAKDLVEQLVRQEQACCGFLHFEMTEHPSGIAVTITAPEEAKAHAAARKNMEPVQRSPFDQAVLKRRSLIETLFDELKNLCQVEHTRHRSYGGFLVNLMAGIIAYCLTPNKPRLPIFSTAPLCR